MASAAPHSESGSPPPACPACGKTLPDGFRSALCPSCLLSVDTLAMAGPGRIPTIEELQPLFPSLEILGLIGSGGMGAVYKARHPRLNRFVAIKTLAAPVGHAEDFALRFEREAQVMARLSHPNIVAVHDFGEIDRSGEGLPGLFYLIMEHVDGTDLSTRIRSGALDPGKVFGFFAQICEALQYAHDEGITHRDIKPANLLVDSKGRVKIADFGLAKLLLGDETLAAGLTVTGTVMGTPHYMAPEQWEANAPIDHRADIYSLGVVLYELLTGKRPVGTIAPPSKLLRIDPRIDGIVSRAMESDPERRFQRVSEIREAAAKLVTKRGERVRRPVVLAGGAIAMFIGLGFAVSAWSPDQRVAGAETSPESSASDNPATSPVNFPPGRWIKVLSTQAEMESDPVNRGKLRDGVRFLDGWMDATACPETPSLQVTGLAGRNCGVRFRGKLGPDRKTWKTYTIMLRTGEPESESRSTYQFALAGLETTRPYLKASLYTFSSRRSDVLASSSDFPPLEPGDEFEMEFLVIGEKLIARYNGRDLLIPNDRRLSSGKVFIQNPQLIRNLEAINLDGLSDAEALNLVAAPGSSDPESGLSPPPPLSQ